MTSGMAEKLTVAAQQGDLVRLHRRFEESYVSGYVQGVGLEFFLMVVVSDRIWFDGFECFRVKDAESLEPAPHAAFQEAALAARAEVRPEPPTTDLTDIESLLTSASAKFPLITIHTERADPDVCYIGRVLSVEGGIVWMLTIDPDAVWDTDPLAYKLNDITRVSFGGDYEGALSLVGGTPNEHLEGRPPPLRLVINED